MRLSFAPPLLTLLALASACTPPAPLTENDIAACSNGRDDDEDTLVDCADPTCSVFSFCGTDAGMPDGGSDASFDAEGLDTPPPTCVQPLDVVLVLDVSATMDGELAAIQAALPAVWARAHELDPTAQFSLVVFVDDVLLVNECAPFPTLEVLVASIETYRVLAPMNRNVADATLPNQDCPENSLDALFDAATDCSFRSASTRIFWHATDDTFAERPAVLSGEWGGGVFVQSTYAEASTAMVSRNIHLGSLARSGAGEFCGAGTSPDVGTGFFTPFGTQLTLPQLTGGAVWDQRELATLGLAGELLALIERHHPCD